MKILVTGGAGYIGSAAVQALLSEGHSAVVVDNLSKGLRKLVGVEAKFYKGDLVDLVFLKKVFRENKIEAVMHFASYKAAGESMVKVAKYSNNIVGLVNLLNCMGEFKVRKMIFSSSAAVYGVPQEDPITEEHSLNPINYYGFTKLEGERILEWYSQLKGIKYVSLRYFNVAGDCGLKYIDPEAQNIFPVIMEVLSGKRSKLEIFGKDYDTPDGTCIRDYIDINDLVRAHIMALELDKSTVINLGSATGCSVLELVNVFEEVVGQSIKHSFVERREGDPAKLVASFEKAHQMLGWKPQNNLKMMIKSSLDALK